MSRLLRRLAPGPREVLRLQLTMVVVFLGVALVLALTVIGVIEDKVDQSERISRTTLVTSQGEALVARMLGILDEGRHAYLHSDDFLSLDPAAQELVRDELHRDDDGAANPALPAVEIALLLQEGANLQRLFDEMLAKTRDELAAGDSDFALGAAGKISSATLSLEAYLKQPTLDNLRLLRARLLILQATGGQAIPDLAAQTEDRFDELNRATDVMSFALFAGLTVLGASGFFVLLVMGRRLQEALATAEGEKESLAARNNQLSALYNVFSEVTDTLSMDHVVGATLRESMRLVRADVVVLRLLEGEELVAAGSLTSSGDVLPSLGAVPLGAGPLGRVGRRGTTLRMSERASEWAFDGEWPEDMQSSLIVPLIVGARVVGTLSCWSRRKGAFGEDDQRVLEMMASQVASAVVAAESTETSARWAHRDALTGLSNRLQLSEDMAGPLKELSEDGGRRAAVAMVDIDRFKRVNDEFGHRVGDETLQGVANVLSGTVRGTDRVYRYGGEEFLMVFTDADEATALALAERLRAAVEGTHWSGHDIESVGSLTVSVGVALLPEHGDNLERLIELADEAMYQAKDLGRNQVALWTPARPAESRVA